jgi:hypothetical protein
MLLSNLFSTLLTKPNSLCVANDFPAPWHSVTSWRKHAHDRHRISYDVFELVYMLLMRAADSGSNNSEQRELMRGPSWVGEKRDISSCGAHRLRTTNHSKQESEIVQTEVPGHYNYFNT